MIIAETMVPFSVATAAAADRGTVFDGPAELRARLRSRREAFVRTVTSKLLTYAFGRGVEHYDQPTIVSCAKPARTIRGLRLSWASSEACRSR